MWILIAQSPVQRHAACHTVQVSHGAGVAPCSVQRALQPRAPSYSVQDYRTCSPFQPLTALAELLLAPSCGNGTVQHRPSQRDREPRTFCPSGLRYSQPYPLPWL